MSRKDIKLNGYTLPENVINSMSRLVKRTKKSDIEYGFNLCAAEEKNEITFGGICKGIECELDISKGCPKGTKDIGDFHTHPRDNIEMSFTDMEALPYEKKFGCIGTNGRMVCYSAKEHAKPACHDLIEDMLAKHREKTRKIPKFGYKKYYDDLDKVEKRCFKKQHIKLY